MSVEIVSEVEAEEIQDRLLLSTVQKIKALCPIPGKDRVEKVEFESCGFTAIVEKGLHAEGDLVLFTKYDSVVADIPPFDWMKDMKFRVKPKSFTIKDGDDVIGKIYSQGIVIRLEAVDKWLCDTGRKALAGEYEEGEDLTIMLGTRKYVAQVAGPGNSLGTMQSKGNYPTHIAPKTDELNLASKVRLLERFKGKKVVGRLKMEGSSLTNFVDPATVEVNVCSRNNNLAECEGNKFWEAVKANHLDTKLKNFPDYVLQAELMGPGVQKNKLNLTQPDMFVFTITNINTKERYSDDEMVKICDELGVKMAPKVAEWEEFDLTFDQLQEIADKLEYLPGVAAEGIVIRPAVPERDPRTGEWLSVKIINRNYTL